MLAARERHLAIVFSREEETDIFRRQRKEENLTGQLPSFIFIAQHSGTTKVNSVTTKKEKKYASKPLQSCLL